MFKCKICGKKFTELTGLYSHLENKHGELIPENMSVSQYYYFTKTGKTNGNCVMCKQPTSWNEKTGKYNRFCTNPKCKEKYAAEFKKRMVGKYGKVHLLNDPEKQREMLSKRKISGEYTWESGEKTTYTGSYELDFLRTLDNFFDWDPTDIIMPSPHNYVYKYNGDDKIYIPDAFIPSLNLEIEIKDGGDNPNMHYKIQDVDKVKEANKDEVLTSQKNFHYIKITNKNYTNFFNFLKKMKVEFEKYDDENKIPRVFMIEDIKSTTVLKEGLDLLDIFEKVNNTKLKDIDFIIKTSYESKIDKPKELQKQLTKMIHSIRDEKDISYIKQLVGDSQTKYHVMLKNNIGDKEDIMEYLKWTQSKDGMRKEFKKSIKDVNKKREKQSLGKLMESNDFDENIMESSISFSILNKYLQDDTNKRVEEYLNDYLDFYNRIQKERPDACKNINHDIEMAKKYIKDLQKSKKVNIETSNYALDVLTNIEPRSIKLIEANDNGKIPLTIVSNNEKFPRHAFMINDDYSKMYIGNDFYLQRLNGKDSLNFKLSKGNLSSENETTIINLQLMMDNNMNMDDIISQLIQSENNKFHSMYKFNGNNDLFKKEILKLLNSSGTITEVK